MKITPDPENYTEAEEHQAFRLMEERGGNFASSLAETWFKADSSNKAKIREAFADLIKDFVTNLRYIAPEARPR